MTRFVARGELGGLPIEEEFDLASDALMFAILMTGDEGGKVTVTSEHDTIEVIHGEIQEAQP